MESIIDVIKVLSVALVVLLAVRMVSKSRARAIRRGEIQRPVEIKSMPKETYLRPKTRAPSKPVARSSRRNARTDTDDFTPTFTPSTYDADDRTDGFSGGGSFGGGGSSGSWGDSSSSSCDGGGGD
jgi:hypothetical protein